MIKSGENREMKMAISEDFRILKWRIWMDMEVLHHITQQFCQDIPSHGLDLDQPGRILTGSDGEMERGLRGGRRGVFNEGSCFKHQPWE